MAFDPTRIPDALKDAYAKGRCAVLVGAGASAGAGLPLWRGLLERMAVEAEKHQVVTAAKAAEYRRLLDDPGKYLMVASGLKEDLHLYFNEFIERTFVGVAPKPAPTELHRALVALDRLQFVLTTNYDTLIERAYRASGDEDVPVLTFADDGELQRRLFKREFFILKAHGDAAKVGNGVVLTEIDYRRLLYRRPAYQSLLATMFTMFTVVFVGASMTDPEVNLLLNYIADAFTPGSGPTHYALMPAEDVTGVERDRWFRDRNVQLIPVSKADGYAEIIQFLRALQAATPAPAGPSAAPPD